MCERESCLLIQIENNNKTRKVKRNGIYSNVSNNVKEKEKMEVNEKKDTRKTGR